MGTIELVRPRKEHEAMAMDYIREHIEHGEPDLHGGALMEKKGTFDEWLSMVENNRDRATVQEGWVPASTFFAIRKEDGKLVGMMDIRHELNDFLREYGGHLGMGVRPSERRKGYATQILTEALDYCRSIGLEKVMAACYKENAGSRGTILKCGGELESEFRYTDGNVVQVFWIGL